MPNPVTTESGPDEATKILKAVAEMGEKLGEVGLDMQRRLVDAFAQTADPPLSDEAALDLIQFGLRRL